MLWSHPPSSNFSPSLTTVLNNIMVPFHYFAALLLVFFTSSAQGFASFATRNIGAYLAPRDTLLPAISLAAPTIPPPASPITSFTLISDSLTTYSLWLTRNQTLCHYTSQNGLAWQPEPSSLYPGSSLALTPNKDDWWCFDTQGVSAGCVERVGEQGMVMYYVGKDGGGR